MRGFQDAEGRLWEVMVGRESWGTIVAIFILQAETGPARQSLLDVKSAAEGNRLLLSLSPEELQSLLGKSVLKSTNQP